MPISQTATPIKQPIFIRKHPNILNIKKIIEIVFFISCIYLIISFIYPFVGLNKIRLPEVTAPKVSPPDTELKQEVRPYEWYLEGVRGHQIFGSLAAPETERTSPAINADLIKDINLVGIIWGKTPQAVIEDKKAQKTYYVSEGQFIGEFQVENIQEGKVILNYRGEKFELYL